MSKHGVLYQSLRAKTRAPKKGSSVRSTGESRSLVKNGAFVLVFRSNGINNPELNVTQSPESVLFCSGENVKSGFEKVRNCPCFSIQKGIIVTMCVKILPVGIHSCIHIHVCFGPHWPRCTCAWRAKEIGNRRPRNWGRGTGWNNVEPAKKVTSWHERMSWQISRGVS